MSSNQSTPQGLSPGDVVFHRDFGAGQVVQVFDEEARRELLIDFSGRPGHRMGYELALRNLERFPPEGLQALLLKDLDKARAWAQVAPLKLVATTLVDIKRPAKPAELERRLARPELLPGKWDSWWKRVQPALKRSPHFHRRSDGYYQLLSSVDEVPEEPLEAPRVRAKPARMDRAGLQEFVRRLELGEASIQSVEGVDNVRLVAEELLRMAPGSDGARRVLTVAVCGPVVSARAVIEEFAKSGQRGELFPALERLVAHIRGLLATPPGADRTSGEQVRAKVSLLEDAVKKGLGDDGDLPQAQWCESLARSLLDLALVLRQKADTIWVSESVASLVHALGALATRQPDLVGILGSHLANGPATPADRVSLLSGFLGALPGETRPAALRRALLVSLTGSPEFSRLAFTTLLQERRQSSMIFELIAQLLLSRDTAAARRAAALLLETGRDGGLADRVVRAAGLMALASISAEAASELQSTLAAELLHLLSAEAAHAPSGDDSAAVEPVCGALRSVIDEALKSEREEYERLWTDLDQRLSACRQQLENAERERSRLARLADQLQAGFRLPEQLASFKGKQEVVQDLADLYQEAFLSRQTTAETASLTWLLIRLESALRKYGVALFGEVDSRQPYDPARHEYIAGSKGDARSIVLKCPGLEWTDPSGNPIVIRRARGLAL